MRAGGGDPGVPGPALHLPEEPDGRHRPQPHRPGRRTGRGPAHLTRRISHELGQTPGLDCPDPWRREGAVQSPENKARHAKVWSHLSRPNRRTVSHST